MDELLESIENNFNTVPPATAKAIEAAEDFFQAEFPADYKRFLQFTNGLEGETAAGYLVIWSAEELIELNKAYKVVEFISNVILIGSDGAEDAFAFDVKDMSIIKLPFIGMGYISNEKLSNSFSDFLSSKVKVKKGFLKRLFG